MSVWNKTMLVTINYIALDVWKINSYSQYIAHEYVYYIVAIKI